MSEVKRYSLYSSNLAGGTTFIESTPELRKDFPKAKVYVESHNYDTALSQLAALREELAELEDEFDTLENANITLKLSLADADRRNDARDAEIAAQVESALRRSFSLGQVYWQQADSDSTCQQNKSDQTMEVQTQHILNVLKSITAALTKPEEAKS